MTQAVRMLSIPVVVATSIIAIRFVLKTDFVIMEERIKFTLTRLELAIADLWAAVCKKTRIVLTRLAFAIADLWAAVKKGIRRSIQELCLGLGVFCILIYEYTGEKMAEVKLEIEYQ